jgi:Na+-driven multidrug efflux pump
VRIKKYYLVFAFAAVSVIALLYGVAPDWFARTFLDVPSLDADLAHILRAVMGLYLALGLFWLYAAFQDAYRNAAILTTIVFCAGLVSGRLLSLAIEGRPAPLLLLYAFMELALVPLGLWVLRRPD